MKLLRNTHLRRANPCSSMTMFNSGPTRRRNPKGKLIVGGLLAAGALYWLTRKPKPTPTPESVRVDVEGTAVPPLKPPPFPITPVTQAMLCNNPGNMTSSQVDELIPPVRVWVRKRLAAMSKNLSFEEERYSAVDVTALQIMLVVCRAPANPTQYTAVQRVGFDRIRNIATQMWQEERG